jgi:hypothetical protein
MTARIYRRVPFERHRGPPSWRLTREVREWARQVPDSGAHRSEVHDYDGGEDGSDSKEGEHQVHDEQGPSKPSLGARLDDPQRSSHVAAACSCMTSRCYLRGRFPRNDPERPRPRQSISRAIATPGGSTSRQLRGSRDFFEIGSASATRFSRWPDRMSMISTDSCGVLIHRSRDVRPQTEALRFWRRDDRP